MTKNNNHTPPNNSNGLDFKKVIGVFLLALVITIIFVLPAEYGVDPSGIGGKLGLLELTEETEKQTDQAIKITLIEGKFPAIPEIFDSWEPDILGTPFSKTNNAAFNSNELIIKLGSGEQVEYKALMQQGDAIVYSWFVNKGIVYTDFHADPGESADLYPDDYFIRYRESETASSDGSIVAPFSGNHGWYWLNIEEHPIEITLKVAGFYSEIKELGRSFQ
ncbi:hypothetical protein N9K05_00815 [Woeseiaceae bacterium]|jgi:hypothetical protein|nr:hypothetical protein [Woeseiaceae bacterium]